MDGFLNVLKPPELSSQDAVAQIRRLAGERVGHGGTLDPDAAGVLPVGVGRALAVLGRIDWTPKTYWARAAVGRTTDSLDAAGLTIGWSRGPWPSAADWRYSARFLRGRGVTRPPARSALRHGGRRAYQEQRAGRMPHLSARPVMVHRLTVLAQEGPDWEFETVVGSGTYVRALVRDWAEAEGHAAHLVALVRTACGPLRIEDAVSLEELAQDGVARHLMSWRTVWNGPAVSLPAADAAGVAQGRWPAGLRLEGAGVHALVAEDRLWALAEAPSRFLRVIPGGLA